MIHIKDYPYELFDKETGEAIIYAKKPLEVGDRIESENFLRLNFTVPEPGTPIEFNPPRYGFRQRKIRVFGHPWHLAHQYELAKLPFFDWSWLIQYKRPYSKKSRTDFMKDRWVPFYEPGKYDVAILHLDQQCVEEEIWQRGKGSLYRELNQVIQDIPKIVIMHGTTYYPEKFSKQEVIERVKEIVGDNPMITNSRQCAQDFGFGTPIIHGLDPAEWVDLPKEIRVVTMVSPGGLDKYYDRTFLENIREELVERDIQHCHITVDWQADGWEDYRNFLGRSLIFLAPFKDSPMPRSRTEAMLSGCCILTTPWQDAGSFITHGENGFIIGDEKTGVPRNPKSVADLIEHLLENPEVARSVGQKGKKTALELFSVENYRAQWAGVLEKVLNRKIDYDYKN